MTFWNLLDAVGWGILTLVVTIIAIWLANKDW